jgi:hypothetical protein
MKWQKVRENCVMRMITSRMKWVGHMAHMGEKNNVYGILVGKLEERNH